MSYRFSEEEDRVLLTGVAQRQPNWIIANNLNRLGSNIARGVVRNQHAVGQRYRMLLNNPDAAPFVPEIDTADAVSVRHCDNIFQQAMRAAIARGVETVRPGIVKDTTPFVGKFIVAPPLFSGCSSSALMCAEQGAPDTRSLTDSY